MAGCAQGLPRPPPRALGMQITSLRNFRARGPLQVCASGSPWKVLGVGADASEKEIKKAHRRLVLKHHPDLAGDNVEAHARFMSIQEAYELLIGKRRGKEIDGRGASGWDFHDWFWQFSMKRRQGKANPSAGAASTDAFRSQWKQQLGGLRQRAASKRAQRAQHAPQQGAAATAATSRSTVWRSTTRNARVHQHAAAQESERRIEPLQGSAVSPNAASAAASAPRAAPAKAAGAAGQAWRAPCPSDEPLEQAVAAAPQAGAHGGRGLAGEQLQGMLRSAVDAVHSMRHSHNSAVQQHTRRVTSHVLALGERLRTRLRIQGLRELLHVDGGLGVGFGDEEGAHLQHGFDDDDPHFGELLSAQYDLAGMANGYAGGEGAARGTAGAHSRKFADREYVSTRVTNQVAGLRRRAALKRECEQA